MSRWRSLVVLLAVVSVAAAITACIELSGPQDELSSVSPISVAWPSVVVNDVLRDIAGVEAPLHLDAFDGDGNVLTDATVNFVTLDQGVSIDSRGVVTGVTESATPVRIVAQVRRGADVIQTPEIRVDVVPRPDSVSPGTDTTYDATPAPLTQTTPIALEEIKVTVRSRAEGKGVKSWLVRYEILSEPPGVDGRRTALYTDGGTPNERVSFDTTDANGAAGRTIAVQSVALQRPASDQSPIRHNVRVLVTVGNSRPGALPTMFFVTLPVDVD